MRARVAVLFALSSLLAAPGRAAAQTAGIAPPRTLRARPVRDTALANVLTNFELLGERAFVRETGLAVRLLAVPGPSGSARAAESDQVVHWLYVTVSEYGELPEQHLYRLGPVYAPHLDSLVAVHRTPVAFVSYGVRNSRQRARIEIRLAGLRITDARRDSLPPSG